jgi:hypothetical protein
MGVARQAATKIVLVVVLVLVLGICRMNPAFLFIGVRAG